MVDSRPAIVLLSGGLDSATAAAAARHEGFQLYALTVRYGQRHAREIAAARQVARALDVERHVELDVNLAAFGGSALTTDEEIPKGRDIDAGTIPSTYVPARNMVLLSLALAWSEALGARDIFIGVNAVDYSGYPDCRPEFLDAFEAAARRATRAGVEGETFAVRAPLLHMTKAQIIRLGTDLGVDYGLTWSCYDPRADGTPCGACDSCRLRARGFHEAGLADPLL
jgi:7-cyano-7-deazaguanine synthase